MLMTRHALIRHTAYSNTYVLKYCNLPIKLFTIYNMEKLSICKICIFKIKLEKNIYLCEKI